MHQCSQYLWACDQEDGEIFFEGSDWKNCKSSAWKTEWKQACYKIDYYSDFAWGCKEDGWQAIHEYYFA